MEIENILVLADFSKDSDNAVKAAVDYVKKYGSKRCIDGETADTA
jgi:hypothetical protein